MRLFSLIAAALMCIAAEAQSWVFLPSAFTHDPATGARVAQYDRIAAVEPLPDPRLVTSGYRRTRSTLRGPDGSVDSTYQVQRYTSPTGGLDAEWERFHDAWQESLLTGSYFYQNQPAPTGAVYGYPGDAYNPTFGPALPNGAYGDPRFSNPFPQRGYAPYGPPAYPQQRGYGPRRDRRFDEP